MLTAWRRYLGDPVASWRTGSPQSQALTLVVLLCGVALCFVVSVIEYSLMPMTTYFLWLLLGMLLLRFRPLAVLCGVTAVAAVGAILLDPPMTVPRVVACLTLGIAVALILFASSRQQSGLPGSDGRGDAGRPPRPAALPERHAGPARSRGRSQSSLVAANSVGYGGDFMIAHLSDDERRLEVILVDVCGKGVQAASRALQFNGALGGLIGALSPDGLFNAANRFLLRNSSDETFATAVHVLVDLPTGYYELTNAGHPPALLWSTAEGAWVRRPRARHRAGHPRRSRAAHDQRHARSRGRADVLHRRGRGVALQRPRRGGRLAALRGRQGGQPRVRGRRRADHRQGRPGRRRPGRGDPPARRAGPRRPSRAERERTPSEERERVLPKLLG